MPLDENKDAVIWPPYIDNSYSKNQYKSNALNRTEIALAVHELYLFKVVLLKRRKLCVTEKLLDGSRSFFSSTLSQSVGWRQVTYFVIPRVCLVIPRVRWSGKAGEFSAIVLLVYTFIVLFLRINRDNNQHQWKQ